MGDRHFVLRHRPGFIGANNGRAAERLNRGQLPDDRLCLIIRCTPRDRATVTMAGSPSGMAATARETPAKNMLPARIALKKSVPILLANLYKYFPKWTI